MAASMLKRGAIYRLAVVARCVCALIFIASPQNRLSAKGGGFHSEDRYNPQHIDSLPPEIRNAIYRKCKTPKALHTFASYSDNMHRIVLHFEHFYCEEANYLCKPSGACLHEVYVSTDHHYRLMRRYYAPAGE